MSVKDMTGQVFGRLLVLSHAGSNKHGAALWNCLCECGTHCQTIGFAMRQGVKRSCGCLVRDTAQMMNYRHGQAAGNKTASYRTWRHMMLRCYNPDTDSYPEYGGMGITVCDRWREDFLNFHADMGDRPVNTTIDRINCAGNYEPGNCRWATKTEQSRNRSALSTNTSGHKNVSWRTCAERWFVSFSVKGKKLYFGCYKDLELAGLIAREARESLHGEFANHTLSRFVK